MEQTKQPEETATMTIKMKRIVRKENKLSQLHIRFGQIPWKNIGNDLTYVYFLLRNIGNIPICQTCHEANNEMPKYFYVGQLKESLMEAFLKQAQIFYVYSRHFLMDPFDETSTQTDGLEKFLKHRRKQKRPCPFTEAYLTADSFERRLSTLNRSLGVEGEVFPFLQKAHLTKQGERTAHLTKVVKFPSIVNMEPTDVAIQDRPDLVDLVVKLRAAIPLEINESSNCIYIRQFRPLKNQFLESIKELEDIITRSINSNQSPKTFDASSVPELAHPSAEKIRALAVNESYVQHLEKTIQTWAKYIDSTMKKYKGIIPKGKGPLPLYDFWAVRHEQLSLFMDDCNQPIIDNLLAVLTAAKSSFAADFKAARRSLCNYYNLCSDNLEYLQSTLNELKVLSRSKRLKEITRVVSDIVDDLRVMWVLSTYWSFEPHFVELLARIRWVICHKVTQILNVPKLFKLGNDISRIICQDAIELMEVWKKSYSMTRSVIEKTRCEQRWEFERDLLFQETEYISQVARSLLDIINMVKNYEDLFCRQFIDTVRDGSKIDSIVHKVKDLTMPLVTADFNVFDREYAENWKILLECFWSDMNSLENEAVRIIRHSFTDLRSAVKSTELISDLRNIISSDKLDGLLLSQFEAVSVQFTNEIKRVLDVFIDNRETPPLLRHHEMYSGSVYWSRSLFCATREVLLMLQQVPEVLETWKFSEALEDYSGFVDMISFYEKSTFVQMLHMFLPIVPEVFEKNIIKIIKKKVEEVSRDDDEEYKEYWEWMAKKKSVERLATMQLASDGGGGRKQHTKRPQRILTRRTIEEDLRGISGSSSMSNSTRSSNVSSEYSSADESEVLSLVSTSGNLDESTDGSIGEEVEVHNVGTLVILKKRVPKKVGSKIAAIIGSVEDINTYPLGDGVNKPFTEILQTVGSVVRKNQNLIDTQKQTLSSYHEIYKPVSPGSTTPATQDSDETNGLDSNHKISTLEFQKRTYTSSKLSASWMSDSKEITGNRSKFSADEQCDQSRWKYSNTHLKYLIKFVAKTKAQVPGKPKKYTTSIDKPKFSNPKTSSQLTKYLREVEGASRTSQFREEIINPHRKSTRGVSNGRRKASYFGNRISVRPVSNSETRTDTSNDSDQKSCDTDSSYTAQQLKLKMLVQSFSKRLPTDSREHASEETKGTDTSTSESGLSDEGSDIVNKVEPNGEIFSPEGVVVGELQSGVPSPEVAVVVARDIYNGVPKNIPGLTPKFVDGFIPPSQLSHPSTYSPIKFGDKTVSSKTSVRNCRKSKIWIKRTKPITFWQHMESDTCSLGSSYTSASLQSEKKYKFTLYSTYQEQYESSITQRDHQTKLVEVEDWSNPGSKSKRKGKKAFSSGKNNEQNMPGMLFASPAKSVRSLVPAIPSIVTKVRGHGRGLPKIYTGCRHDVKRFSWNEFIGTDILMEHGYSIQINYSGIYESAIQEVELFEDLGYDIPEDLRHISIMKNTIHSDIECAVKMVRKYTSIIESLKPTQVAALKRHIGILERTMYFGLTQYTWSSLNIPEFCSSVMGQLNNLQYLTFQLQYMESSIESIALKINEIDCFQCPLNAVHNCQIFFKFCDYKGNEAAQVVKKHYHEITLILYKMECLLFSTMTGCSEYLLLYYVWAENTLFDGLLSFVIRNLSKYEEFLLGNAENYFSVEAGLYDKMICLKPELPLVTLELASQAEKIVGTLSAVVRWREGTCHFAPQLKSSSTGSIHRYIFVEDLIHCREVRATIDHIYETISLVTEAVDQYMEKWNMFSHLWIFDEGKSMRKFLSEEPTLAEYDECFSCYQSTIEELNSSKPAANVYCVRIRVKTLSQTILNIGLRWKSIMGELLLVSSRHYATKMRMKTEVLYEQLIQSIVSLETFQCVLQAVNDCSSFEVEAELNLIEIQERHYLLRMWTVKIPLEDNQMARDIENFLENLRRKAAYRTHLLAPAMKLFVTKAIKVCDIFSKTSALFGKKYFSEGPGTYVNDLDRGLEELQGYEREFANTEAKRTKMVQAEKLFDLQPMNFDVFCQAHQTLKYELIVFDIYRRQRDEKESWNVQLWNNFNPNKLLIWIDSYLGEVDKLPDKCKSMPISISIWQHMINFKTSVSLMVELQNKALRQRHWDELMEKTKYTFIMDQLHTKMKDLFSMKLHEHNSLIAEVIANAEKEAIIEANLYVISERWLDQELPIVQRYKSNRDHSVQYTLGFVDDTIALMDNSIEDLLVMSQSRDEWNEEDFSVFLPKRYALELEEKEFKDFDHISTPLYFMIIKRAAKTNFLKFANNESALLL